MAPLSQSSRHAPCAVHRGALESSRHTLCAVHLVVFVVVAYVQFLVFPANAGLHGTYTEDERVILQEISIPEAAGRYYREPGQVVASEGENRWFGPEINSQVLCPDTAHKFNESGFFDIIYTREDAKVWPSSIPGKLWWYRQQEWRFATADTPWGTDTVHITLVSEIRWTDIDATDSITGFPWSGFEEHWRDGDTVKSKAEIVGYYQYVHAGEKYIAPKYYKRGTSSYSCTTAQSQHNLKILKQTDGHFTRPKFRSEVNKFSRREKGAPEDTSNWYDCIRLKSAK